MTRLKGKCGGCLYFEPTGKMGGSEYGFCNRYPPVSNGTANVTPWPIVNSNSGCGEYEAFIAPVPTIQDMM